MNYFLGFAKLLLWAVAFSAQTNATLYTDVSQLPTDTFDYVVVGAGTAGNVVANRLTENPKISVLLLEAGVWNEGVLASEIPLLCPSLTGTLYDWNYTTTAQTGYNNRKLAYPRGKLLGGSSSINYMTYTRGSRNDWDKYAAITGDAGWSWDSMRSYMLKNEKFVHPPGNISITGKYSPAQHSTTGVVSVSVPGYALPIDDLVIQTTRQQSSEWPFNIDMNSGETLGIGWLQATIGNGTRSSSAASYLGPQYITRQNLHVLINAQATKLFQTGTYHGRPSFHKVEFGARAGAKRTTVTATLEIIVSAGSIGTPQLLQLSGIGDAVDLAKLNITSTVSLPGVGKNLSDHAIVAAPYFVKSNDTYDTIFRDPALLEKNTARWMTSKTGPLANTVANHLGWFRLPSNASIFETGPDPASGPNSSHWEIIFDNTFLSAPSSGNFFTVLTALITPTSRGAVKITSTDPFTAPDINPNFLSTAFDVFTLVEAFKAGKRFVSKKPWSDYIKAPFEDVADTDTDKKIEQYVRRHGNSVQHPVGTASMSPANANWGVVNPDLTLKRAAGLRIVDASVFPFIPGAHTQVPVYLVAERASVLIKESQGYTLLAERAENDFRVQVS